MFQCRSCLIAGLRAISRDAATNYSITRPASHSIRAFATAIVTDGDRSHITARNETFRPDRSGRPRYPKDLVVNVDLPKDTPEKARRDTALQKELKWIQDPLKLAEHIRLVLRSNDFDKALAMARLASKEMDCVVSWNHMINWLMIRRQFKAAFKLYNEMKKRGQFPDSYTIILLLRGLAQRPVKPADVGQALALYHSLYAPNSRVTPSIMHTNAALKVCAEAEDMDTLWSVASEIPDRGPGAADSTTFTIILKAIHENAIRMAKFTDIEERERLRRSEQAISEGKRIWEDIIGKWRSGDLEIDEQLICAMGRLLLVGTDPRDWDNVLSMIEQTMNVTRLISRIGSEDRSVEHLRGMQIKKLRKGENAEEYEEDMSNPKNDIFSRSSEWKARKINSGIFVKPGNSTVSLIFESCSKMMAPQVAYDYWDFFKDPDGIGITPDLENYHALLRVMRQARASGRVVNLIQPLVQRDTPPELQAKGKTFRIAMSTCNRDKNNPSAIDHASTILDYMERTMSQVDSRTVHMYLDLVVSTNDPTKIVDTLSRLSPIVRNVKSQLSFGGDGPKRSPMGEADVLAALRFLKSVISTINRLMTNNQVPREDFTVWSARRHKISDFVNHKLTNLAKKDAGFAGRGKITRDMDAMGVEVEDRGMTPRLSQTSRSPTQSQDPESRGQGGTSSPGKRLNWRQEMPRLAQRTPGNYAVIDSDKIEKRRTERQLRNLRRNEAEKQNRVIMAADKPLMDSPTDTL